MRLSGFIALSHGTRTKIHNLGQTSLVYIELVTLNHKDRLRITAFDRVKVRRPVLYTVADCPVVMAKADSI